MKKKRGPVVYTKLQQGETMKSIDGFSHYYITNFGRVLSTRPLGRKGSPPSELREITLSFGTERYYYCNIYDDNSKRHSKRVNRMVYGYHNPINDELKKNLVVDHKDDNKKNNNISNLTQITYGENSRKYHASKRLKRI